jgi:hypothetical protein
MGMRWLGSTKRGIGVGGPGCKGGGGRGQLGAPSPPWDAVKEGGAVQARWISDSDSGRRSLTRTGEARTRTEDSESDSLRRTRARLSPGLGV